jgi:hypothetical protein
MTDFNYKKYLTENKLTQTTKLRAGILAEGQFSWMTQDTGQQIGSQKENTIPVYMFDNTGKYYYENSYDGYGEFGGVDYYELLDKMNGGSGDRSRGIDLAFGKEKVEAGEVLFPALVTKPNLFNYKYHNFTQEPESDPNQSWYTPEEDDFYDQNDEEEYGDNEDEDDDMMEGLNEGKMYFHVLEDGGYGDIGHQGVYDTKEEAQNRADKLADMFPASSFYVEASDSKDEPYNVTMEGKKEDLELQETEDKATYDKIESAWNANEIFDKNYKHTDWSELPKKFQKELYNTHKKDYQDDAEADDAEHIEALEKDMKDDKKSGKMKKSELKDKIKEMILKEMNITEDTFAPESEEDFLAEVDRILAEADEVAVDDTEVAVDGKENIDVDTTIQVDPNVKAVQDALTQAQAAAQKLGDPKLTDQIGNTITFFTRAHVVEKGAVAEAAEADETTSNNLQYVLDWWEELPFEKKKEIFHQSHEAEDAAGKYKMNEVEGKLVDEKTGKEVTLPYETLDFRGDPMTVISFRAPHKPSSTGRIYTKGGGEYFPSVAGLKIIDHSFSEDLNESMFPMLKKILK